LKKNSGSRTLSGSAESADGYRQRLNHGNEWIQRVRHRLLGEFQGEGSGPVVLVVACLHGNEISGADAALRVLSYLRRGNLKFHGHLVAILGNVPAYDARLRFIEEDLNRIWTHDRVKRAALSSPASVEDGQMSEIHSILKELDTPETTGKYLLDLHTTSAAGPPFIVHAGEGKIRDVVRRIDTIEVRRVSEYLKGMMVQHAGDLGWNSIAFEAGSHMQADSMDIHEILIWNALAAAKMVDDEDIPLRIRLRHSELKHPDAFQSSVDVVHHHLIQDGDRFRMRKGYQNFQEIELDEVIAEDRHGLIHAPVNGRIFMPLYQNEGRDGFFIVRDHMENAHEDAA
jgi:succinylglutamate desuccinylase